ncbi:MAG: glycosyltransferase, partial [Gemmatimonadota bacterium]|nr:glycosyltransferase [Gemmatimonadota bacterium]
MGKPVTLGVSGWRLHGQRTGVGRYLLNLIQNWTPDLVAGRYDRITIYTPVPFDGGDISLPEGISHKVLPPGLPMVAWENLRLGPFAGESVMLYPSFSRPLLTRGASVVVTHDATMRLHPELFTSRDKRFYDPLYGWSSRAATLVITTTNAAKADITREWNVEGEKIHVTHLASAECFRPLETSVDRSAMRQSLTGSDTPYFLFVGKLSGRRNLPKLLEAFAVFRRTTGHPHNLLMVGPQYAITALEKLADELGVRSHLITRTFVKDPELNDLYNCAHAFV